MRRIQYKIEEVWATYIGDDVDLTDKSELHNAIADSIARENTTPKILFFDNVELVCSECGISLNLDEEKEDGKCVQCEAEQE